jgi:hypothetical protein
LGEPRAGVAALSPIAVALIAAVPLERICRWRVAA